MFGCKWLNSCSDFTSTDTSSEESPSHQTIDFQARET